MKKNIGNNKTDIKKKEEKKWKKKKKKKKKRKIREVNAASIYRASHKPG